MRLCFLLACICRLVSADVCVMCTPGKYQTGFSSHPCRACEVNTHAPASGMTTCIACANNSASAPGSSRCACVYGYTRTNSSSECSLVCDAGFAKNVDGACVQLSEASVVLKLDMTLALPEGATTDEVQLAILGAVSAAYNISPEYLQVTVTLVLPASRRRLLQTSAARYAVEVRVLFQAGTSAADVSAMQSRLSTIDSTQLNAALRDAPDGIRVSVLSSSLTESSVAVVPSATPARTPVVTTTPVVATTPAATPSTTPAVTPATTPAPTETQSTDIVPLIAGGGAALAVVLVVAACWLRARTKSAGTSV